MLPHTLLAEGCRMLSRPRTLPAGFVAPCLDGFRVIARKNGAKVRLYSRRGNS
jgi:ATP-dependent DNA ligase